MNHGEIGASSHLQIHVSHGLVLEGYGVVEWDSDRRGPGCSSNSQSSKESE